MNLSQLSLRMQLPVIAAPMFLISSPELLIEQCKAGIVGSLAALTARTSEIFDQWLSRISSDLKVDEESSLPYAINLVVHSSNSRLMDDLEICEKYKVPIIITSLSVREDVISRIHAWGGVVIHDVVNTRHAKKAIDLGVDGLVLVCAGAGGHAGSLNPFAFLGEVRTFFTGPVALAGAISNGAAILSAKVLGADFAYVGTRFIATKEASAADDYKRMILESSASDIVYTSKLSVASASFINKSLEQAGYNPHTMEIVDAAAHASAKVWKDIFSAGQGVGQITDIPTVNELINRLTAEFEDAINGYLRTH